MSDAFILSVGGGGGISEKHALIHVIAAIGSTISFSYHGVVIKVLGPEKGHTNANDSALSDWYYSINPSKYGEWTVSASVGNIENHETINVTQVRTYDVELYKYYIFREKKGLVNGFSLTARSTIPEMSNDRIDWSNSVGVGNQLWFTPTINFNTRKFRLLVFDLECRARYNTDYAVYFGIGPNLPSGENYGGTYDKRVTPAFYQLYRREVILDISNLGSGKGDSEYVKMSAFAVTGWIYNVYLCT